MNLLTSLNDLSIGEAGILGGLGYGVVFLGLIALMIVVIAIGKIFSKKKTTPAPEEVSVAVSVEEIPGPVAPGSAGRLKIYNVPPKTAAMLMAIVANQMGKPLNELRFISIKEVK